MSECSGCRKVFPIRLMKKGEFITKKSEAILEGLEILENADNPTSGLVLVKGYFCIPCYRFVCGESEKIE